MDALQQIADRKAAIIANMMRGPARDIYLMTRISNWLLFGGIRRSNTTTDVNSASEQCKTSREGECHYTSPCSCDWEYRMEDNKGDMCNKGFNTTDSRYLQRQWFEVQKLDSDSATGFRRSSPSFPLYLNSSERTVWWHNISELPGSMKGPSDASGYRTLFDRVVVSSASSVINMPIYNYASGLRRGPTFLGAYLTFADDGLMLGWSGGCNDWHSKVSHFVNSDDNGAPLIDSNLCASGKYGYDPRCRGWYAQGRESYLQSNVPAHVTPLYKFAFNDEIAQSITSPLANRRTGEYVGQVVLDFKVNYERIVKMIPEENSLSFLITPTEDILGGDTVVSPRSEKGWSSAKIGDLLFSNEPNDINRDYFEENVLPLMKAGERGNVSFSYTKEDESEEKICLYFSPVKIPMVVAKEPADFTAATKVSEYLVYSIGAGKPCDEIKRPYDGVEDAVNEDLMSLQHIFVLIIILSTVFFVIFSVVAGIYIAFPMIQLSNIVTNTKKGEFDSIPPLEGGCKEVQGVYNTFAKLNKIIKVSNRSFFYGNLDMAHHFVSDALILYRKINDRKAIGVTCNNLANTLFAIRYEQMDEVHCCDSSAKNVCFVKEALSLYNEAVNYSQQDFDRTEDSDLKVNYAIQLADRLFNRGLYLLFIDGYDCAPEDSRQRGYNDVTFSRNLHYDIRDYFVENKQLFSNASSYFSRLIRRINCLAAFYDDVGLREIWDAQVLLDEADQLARAAVKVHTRGLSCPLFEEVYCSGRLQQLEELQVLLAMNSGDNIGAARIGMRMIVEDTFLLESSFVRAAEALLRIMKDTEKGEEEDVSLSKRTIECLRDDLGAMIKSCKKESLDIGKNSMFVFEMCPSEWSKNNSDNCCSVLLDELNNQCLKLYDGSFSSDDPIGIVSNNVNHTRSVEIGNKEENEGRQRNFLDVATSTYSDPPSSSDNNSLTDPSTAETCFPIGLQMLIDSSVSLQNDSYIVWITDGYTRYESSSMISLRNQIARLNEERCYQIHVLVIGLNNSVKASEDNNIVDNENVRQQQIQLLEDIGDVSKNSFYINTKTEEELRRAFIHIASTLSNHRATSQFISFLTMEKF